MLTFIIFGLGAAVAIALLTQLLEAGELAPEGKALGNVGPRGWVQTAVVGVLVGAMGYVASTWMQTVPFLLAALAVMAILAIRSCFAYCEYGRELACYVGLIGCLLAAALNVVNFGIGLPEVTKPVAWAVAIVACGLMVVGYLKDQHELVDEDGEELETGGFVLPVLLLALVAAALILANAGNWSGMLAGQQFASFGDASFEGDASLEAGAGEETAGTGAEIALRDGLHFYNADLQSDGKAENDFNFGPNPYVEGKKVDFYTADFAGKREKDPALLAATMVALDGTLNTDYIGEVLYEGYDESLNMLERADAATLVMVEDSAVHTKATKAVAKLLSSAKKVELKELTGMTDQLYMNPATVSGVPGIVDYAVDYDKGLCLVYTFQIKSGSNTTQQVAFHLACGYQWTDGAAKIGVTPQPKPSSPSSSPSKPSKKDKDDDPSKPKKKSKDDKPSKPSKKDKDDDPSKPSRKPKKDKDQGTQGEEVKPGEADPDTNNPSNPSRSKADKDDSTANSGKSYEEVKKDEKEKEEANSGSGGQKSGGEDSKPSTPAKSDTKKEDNNGKEADKPTKKSDGETPTAKEKNDGDNDGHVVAPD